jgi:histone deacetylase complex regulatory component SIN3
MNITRQHIEAKRAEYQNTIDQYQRSIFALQGALQAMDELLAETQDAMTLDQLGATLGVSVVGEPEPLDEGEQSPSKEG